MTKDTSPKLTPALQQVLQHALHHLQSGRPVECARLCDEILAGQPESIQAIYLRGCAAWQTGDIARSVTDLEIVHGNQPQHLHAAYYYGRSLRAAGRLEEALAPLQAALSNSALEVHARYELAACLAGLRHRDEAIAHYQAVLKVRPDNAQAAANLASLLERENRLEDAEYWADRALQMDSANETAQMTRATLDRRRGDYPRAAQRLRGLIGTIDNPINRSIAWNQLGQCLEGLHDWDGAFGAFSESNRILLNHHPRSRPDPRGPHGLQTLARIRAWLQENPLASWKEPRRNSARTIAFLVGFPRSGTTLLDRMLSAHPDIEVLEEKSLFSVVHRNWSEAGALEALAAMDEVDITTARESYLREMSRHRRHPQRLLTIDKLPQNLAYLFLIYRLFPEAPVIFLQRHPLDACISCYFQAFELVASMGYFLDLRDTARYYDAVMQVAQLSMNQVRNPLHRLRYEDLVASPEPQLKALTGFLELKWADSMLDYRRQSDSRASNTPSYQQVLQPLHSGSIGKWRHYAEQLRPALAVLQPWVQRFGYREPPAP